MHLYGAFNRERIGKCVTKYAAAYERLRAAALASTESEACDAVRFVDNGDGTVTDNLTRLLWEQKGNLDGVENASDLHDADNAYTWSNSAAVRDRAEGTAFTVFLNGLNTAGFAGQYNWRMPTAAELVSIAQPAYPACPSAPCIDPTFGATASGFNWSSSSGGEDAPHYAVIVDFREGDVAGGWSKTADWHVRAVRGGF